MKALAIFLAALVVAVLIILGKASASGAGWESRHPPDRPWKDAR